MLRVLQYRYILLFLLPAILFQSCIKEYSYERQDNTPPVIDTTPPQQIPPAELDFPYCGACDGKDQFEEGKWSFTAGISFLCGDIDTAIILAERTAFTFFGPSACAADMNVILTVYLNPFVLDHDQKNLFIPKVSFYYSKLGAAQFPLISRADNPFYAIIHNYNHQSKIANGTFTGYAYKPDLRSLPVTGKFKVKLL